ncbi:hypothetical protein [Haladaptatus sp. DFWS20]|uniref:hypothetical protein n=1 Tax=Haladaptatus sp. DFWS20 TaxID=3403467 RepID=UPI003EC0E042
MDGKSPNKEILRRVVRKLGNISLVTQVNPFSFNKPATVEVVFDETAYPEQISYVYIDIELQLNGDFYIHYVEEWERERKECRWDRHENPHNARDHYHPFPAATTDDAEDRRYPEDFFDVIGEVITDIQSRWGETFEIAD